MKILMSLFVILGLIGSVKAYEIKENPDQRISFGLNYFRNSVTGDYESPLFKVSDAGELTSNHIVADIRIPLTSFLTFSVGGGYSMDKMRITFVSNDKYDMKGYNLNAGIRLYLP
jgi:hypothetical protein